MPKRIPRSGPFSGVIITGTNDQIELTPEQLKWINGGLTPKPKEETEDAEIRDSDK